MADMTCAYEACEVSACAPEKCAGESSAVPRKSMPRTKKTSRITVAVSVKKGKAMWSGRSRMTTLASLTSAAASAIFLRQRIMSKK